MREMDQVGDKTPYVRRWEAAADKSGESSNTALPLADLMGLYLFRTRRWVHGLSALKFTNNEICEFKGVSLTNDIAYRYVKTLRGFADLGVSRPQSITQPILNGALFFDYVDYYLRLYSELFSEAGRGLWRGESKLHDEGVEISIADIVFMRNCYKGWWNVGDQYIRDLFMCALLFYYDKFGRAQLEDVALAIFIWAYRERLQKYRIHKSSVDNRAKEENGAFRVIARAVHPEDVIEALEGEARLLKKEIQKDRNIKEITAFFTVEDGQ